MALPDEVLLRKLEESASPFFMKMTQNAKENIELARLRDWLLSMLMNGEVIIKDS